MPDNLRHAQYSTDGIQIDSPQLIGQEVQQIPGDRNMFGDGANPLSLQTLVLSTGIPFVVPSSGNVTNTSGAIAATLGHDYVIGPSYTYFPAAQLNATSAAGWYYTLWTSATVATVYANTYQNGQPVIPLIPTPLVTVVGAYTQVTAFDIVGPSLVIPGNFMGLNGLVEWNKVVNSPNTADNKTFNTYFGGNVCAGLVQSTNPKAAATGTVKNRGRVNAQIAVNASFGDSNNASSLPKFTVDTTQATIVSLALQLAANPAANYAIIESCYFRVTRGN